MGDDSGEGEDGQTEFEINREENFRAFWANAYAEFGTANTVQDFLASIEGKVQLAAAFSTSAIGLQIDTCLGALGMEVDAGKKFEVINGLRARFKVADAEAICNDAEAAIVKAETRMVDLDSKLTELKSNVEYFESGLFDLSAPAVQAVL